MRKILLIVLVFISSLLLYKCAYSEDNILALDESLNKKEGSIPDKSVKKGEDNSTTIKTEDQAIAGDDSDKELVESKIQKTIVAALILGLLLTIALGAGISAMVSKPLSEMSVIARRMAKGDFSKKIYTRSNDEIGDLAMVLNHMAEEIRNKIKKISHEEAKLAKEISSGWTADRKLPDQFSELVLNAINFTCGTNGVLVVRPVNLAPPMVPPRISLGNAPAGGAE